MVFHTSYIITGLLLAALIYLISKRNNENKCHLDYLILSVFALFVNGFIYSFSLFNSSSTVSYFFYFYIFRILHFIFFYKYIVLLGNEKSKNNAQLFSPLAIFLIIYLLIHNEFTIFFQDDNTYLEYELFDSNIKRLLGAKSLFTTASIISIYFLVVILMQIKKLLKKINQSKQRSGKLIKWIYILYSYLFISTLAQISNYILLILNIELFIIEIIIQISISSTILYVIFSQNKLQFAVDYQRQKNISLNPIDQIKYEVIIKYLDKNKMYLNPEKKVMHLAKAIKMTVAEISGIIYKIDSLSVHNFFVKKRIEYAKQKINEDYLILFSIESLFKESGFKSAPPFYKAFKKFVGKTPKEYQNSIKITDSVESENIKH